MMAVCARSLFLFQNKSLNGNVEWRVRCIKTSLCIWVGGGASFFVGDTPIFFIYTFIYVLFCVSA